MSRTIRATDAPTGATARRPRYSTTRAAAAREAREIIADALAFDVRADIAAAR